MPAILNRLSILFIARDLDNTKILLYKLSVPFRTWLSNLHLLTRHKTDIACVLSYFSIIYYTNRKAAP